MADNSATQTQARSLGEEMRAIRKSARASIEQAESDLRIKAKYIEAIEAGDASALPSRVYADGFLRNYAIYLGLDPEDVQKRFYSEAGVDQSADRKRKAPKSRPVTVDPLAGITGLGHNDRSGPSFGRSMAALWPLVLVGGIGFGAYAGYKYADEAGLIPAQFGGAAEAAGEPAQSAAAEPDESANLAESNTATPEKQVAKPARKNAPAATVSYDKAEAVGEEDAAGGARPDTLSYARTGATPYWQTPAPDVASADGPVADIKPEKAGVVPSGEPSERGRWSVTARENGSADAPSAAEASRIAAQTREALAATLGFGLDTPAPRDETADNDETPEPAIVTSETIVNEEPDFGAAVEPVGEIVTEPSVTVEASDDAERITQTYISTSTRVGTSVSGETFAAQPGIAPGSFALHANADTWVQVRDASGQVRYTGILSPGESYNIPEGSGWRLQTGNAGGLFIEIDGQRFGPLGNDGAIMRNVPLNPGSIRASYTLARQAILTQ